MTRINLVKFQHGIFVLMVVIILAPLVGCGQRSSHAGTYMVQLSVPTNVDPAKRQETFLALRNAALVLNADGTYKFGEITGTWSAGDDTVTLTPSSGTTPAQAYPNSLMAESLKTLLTPATFKAMNEGKTLVSQAGSEAVKPLEFVKAADTGG